MNPIRNLIDGLTKKPHHKAPEEEDDLFQMDEDEEEEPEKPTKKPGLHLPHFGMRREKEDAIDVSLPDPAKKTPLPPPGKPLGKQRKKAPFILLGGMAVMAAGLLGYSFLLAPDVPNQPVHPPEHAERGETDGRTAGGVPESLYVNPFVEMQQAQNAAKSGNPVQPGSQVIPARSLPAIPSGGGGSTPSYTPSSVPRSMPLPAIPQSPVAAGSTPQQAPKPPSAPKQPQASVSGVFTGEDGKNMAVMSDGTVVAEGESYQDGRIAFIGGDGITFDNGKTIPYGDQ